MKKNLFICGVVGVLALGSGCASTCQFVALPDQGKAIENPEKGRIYVMRPAFIGCAISMKVKDGETLIGKTGPRGYLCWERDPGAAEIIGRAENTSKLPLTIEKGKAYYVIQHLRPGIFFARNTIALVDEAKGKQNLKKCKPPVVRLRP